MNEKYLNFTVKVIILAVFIHQVILLPTGNVSTNQVQLNEQLNWSKISDDETSRHQTNSINLVGWRWTEVSAFLIVSLFILIAALVKLAYHHTTLHAHLPESCILVLLGIAFEVACTQSNLDRSLLPIFSPSIFFFVLLPPVILESAYSLHDRTFFNNLGTILLYAVIGTLLNIFIIGLILAILCHFTYFNLPPVPLIECLVFSTLIAAVDPVAVLAIFQEISVNKSLYFLVFGESLFNDAVVITVYNCISIFASSTSLITISNVSLGMMNFFTVSCGGLIIGLLWGMITSLITRFTRHISTLEPLIVLICAYLAYVTSELVHFSGIISLIACGIMQAEYSQLNITNQSYVTIKYITRNLSALADVIIFFFLGQVLVRETHEWSTSFTILTLILCIIIRFVTIYLLTYIANYSFHRVHLINLQEQLVMAYGGLRGAIAFSLSILLDKNQIKYSSIFISSTLFIILFTVFVLGSTTKLIVRLLQVRIEVKEEPKMFLFLNDKLLQTVIIAIEDITGNQSYFHLMTKFSIFNDEHIKPLLCKNWHATSSQFTQTLKRIRHSSASKIINQTQIDVIAQVDDHEQLTRVKDDQIASECDKSDVIHKETRQPSGWIRVRNAMHFTSMLKQPTSPNLVVPLDLYDGPSNNTTAATAAASSSFITNQGHTEQTNSARRQLNSALSRSTFYQLPGSFFLLTNEMSDCKSIEPIITSSTARIQSHINRDTGRQELSSTRRRFSLDEK